MIDTLRLKSLFKIGSDLAEELTALDSKEAECRAKLSKALENAGISDPKIQRLVGDNRCLLDMIAARRPNVEKAIVQNARELRSAYDGYRRAWNSDLKAAIAATVERLTDALAPFFEGHRGLASCVDSQHWPVIHEMRRRSWDPAQPSDENLLQMTKALMAHVQLNARLLDASPKPETSAK